MKFNKIIIFTGGIETQEFFSLEMADTFVKLGYQVFDFDLTKELGSMEKLLLFYEPEKTIMLTFNFHGISGEEIFVDEWGKLFWDEMDIPCYNIVVDHPLYYHKFLKKRPKKYYHISIDRCHQKYMKKFFPNVDSDIFLPLGGTALQNDIPLSARKYDVMFTGNYTALDTFKQYITRLDDDYTAFYYGMIDDLLNNTDRTLEEVAEEHIRREIPGVTEDELKETMPNLNFIDLYVRFYERGELVRTLAESGIKVHVCGEGWNKLICKNPENVISHGSKDSYQCLKMIGNSRISLNVMPWFKDGAHDRIFNSCLNHALCVSDDSLYLKAIFKDNSDIVFYDLHQMDQVADRIKELLLNPGKLRAIADAGLEVTRKSHTWECRTKELLKQLG
ncbi:MAG: glycosyltransferase [Lachnospiraceae bacterium]|nr:glycosyltransferase [Lachnospiraceae bacterium]